MTIDLNANLQKLQGDLDQAAKLSDQASQRIQKSADSAGQALGDAANAADFGALSQDAASAASSMDKLKTSATGAGTEVGKAKTQLQSLIDTLQQEASSQFEKVQSDAKTASTVLVVGTGIALAAFVGVAAAAVYRLGIVAFEAAGFVKGLFTGESYQTQYIDGLIKANEKVIELQTSLGITAASASALGLALDRIGVPKGDYVSVYTATESAIRKAIAAQEDLNKKVADARHTSDTDAITAAEKAVSDYTNAFQRLGVAYQDDKGRALDYQTVIQNAAKVLDTYTAGFDRNAAAAELGLGSAEKVAAAAKVNSENFAEAAQRQKDYYLVIGPGAQAAVDEYQAAMRIFRNEADLTSQGFQRAIADATIPILTEFANLLKDGFPEAVGAFRGAMTGLVTVFQGVELGFKALYEAAALAMYGVATTVITNIEAANKALHFDFSGARQELENGAKAIEDRFGVFSDNLVKNRDKAQAAINLAAGQDSQGNAAGLNDKGAGRTYTPPPDKPAADATKGAAPNVDVAKKLLEQQLKALELFIADEKQQLTERDEFLSLYYQHSDISIRDYFAQRATVQQAYVASAKQAYNEEIADLEAYIAKTKANGNLSDDVQTARVTDAQTKLIEVRSKLRKVESDANQETLRDWFANRQAVEAYGDKLKGLEAQIASAGGDTAKAFGINFEAQTRDLKRQLTAVLNSDNSTQAERNQATQGILDLDSLRRQGLATSQLNDLNSQRSVIMTEIANTQARIDLSVSTGQRSELQGLAATSQANAARLADLQKIIDAEQKIAEGIDDPFAKSQALANVDALRVEMEKLAAQTDLVGDKFRDAGKSIATNFLEKLESGTVKAKDLFKSLAADINSEILKIANKSITDKLFAKDGALGGLLNQLGGLFGSGSDSGSSAGSAISGAAGAASKTATTAANDAAFATLTTTVTAADTAVTAMATAATDAAASLAALGASSGASSAGEASSSAGIFSSLLDVAASAKGNVFAGGNILPFARGGVINQATVVPMALMGEAGPEAVMPLRRGPNGSLGVVNHGGQAQPVVHQTNNFILQGAPSTATQAQIASKVSTAAYRAQRRSG